MFSRQQDNTAQGIRQRAVQIRHPLLKRHPILYALAMIGGAILIILAGFSADVLFPLLARIGVSIALPCLLLGIVVGISGILAGIIGTLEYLDEQRAAYAFAYHASNQTLPGTRERRANCLHPKEHRYDRN